MMMKDSLIFVFMTSTFIVMYIFNKYHIFNSLIICEYAIVTILIILFTMTSILKMENYMIMFILVILITESVLGLSLMINLIRTHSNDFTKSMTIMKF